jgi:signal transduction histidine kinase
MLQTFADGRVPDKSHGQLYAMGLKEAERLEHMVENILISGRLRGGRYQLQVAPVDLRPMLESFIAHRRRYLIKRPEAISLQWEPRKNALSVQGDPDALRVILDNLVDNAFKYGGAAPRVIVWVREFNKLVEITVEDNGIGFLPEKAEELFVPFQRSEETRDSAQPGTGLGLSIARALARRMGGELVARSEGPGQGSRFSVTLRESES